MSISHDEEESFLNPVLRILLQPHSHAPSQFLKIKTLCELVEHLGPVLPSSYISPIQSLPFEMLTLDIAPDYAICLLRLLTSCLCCQNIPLAMPLGPGLQHLNELSLQHPDAMVRQSISFCMESVRCIYQLINVHYHLCNCGGVPCTFYPTGQVSLCLCHSAVLLYNAPIKSTLYHSTIHTLSHVKWAAVTAVSYSPAWWCFTTRRLYDRHFSITSGTTCQFCCTAPQILDKSCSSITSSACHWHFSSTSCQGWPQHTQECASDLSQCQRDTLTGVPLSKLLTTSCLMHTILSTSCSLVRRSGHTEEKKDIK